MPLPGRPLVGILALLLPLTFARAATPTPGPEAAPIPEAATPRPAPMTLEQAYAKQGIKLIIGPATVPIGDFASLKLPAHFGYVGKDALAKYYEVTHNNLSGNEVGVMLSPDDSWELFFDYNAVGYIKDDEKDKLDAPKLLTTMTFNQEEANAARKDKGWSTMKILGWANPPHYDEKTHNLKWAINLNSSADNFKSTFINESIRLLGRGGVMEVTLVSGNDSFKSDEAASDALLASSFEYTAGQKYSEFRSGDKIAEYGLGALVLGGAGVLAAKAGLFAKLGVFLASAWKLVVVAIVALGGFFKKMWKKITGRA